MFSAPCRESFPDIHDKNLEGAKCLQNNWTLLIGQSNSDQSERCKSVSLILKQHGVNTTTLEKSCTSLAVDYRF